MSPMRPQILFAIAALQLFMVAAGYSVRSWPPAAGWVSFDLLAVVPPFLCYVVALYGAPFLLRRHPVVRFAAFAPTAMTLTLTVFFTLKLIGHFVTGQFEHAA